MKSYIYRVPCIIVSIAISFIFLLNTACTQDGNQPPKIIELKASTTRLYPKGSTELECLASDPEGDTMTFTWSCIDGTFAGSGPVTTWRAPNAYGDFRIMVIVDDNNGNRVQSFITIGVIVNENDQGCDTCPNRR